MTRYRRLALLAVLLVLPGAAHAQRQVRRELLRAPNGMVLDFSPDGAWRKQAAAVARYRAGLMSNKDFGSLNAAAAFGAPGSAAAVTGTRFVPAILFRYQDVGTGSSHASSEYDQALFSQTPPLGRPYTYRTYYEQLSHNLFSIQGQAIGWVTLSKPEIQYTGDPASDGCTGNPTQGNANSCNGLFSGAAQTKMLAGVNEAITAVDTGTFDWSQFDSDNDGFVDFVVLLHSETDGACGGTANNHLWSHRSSLSPSHLTHTPWAGHPGQFVRVRDYVLQSAVGGNNGCSTPASIMPVGTIAHETGHALGLPDLYDVTGPSEGIGQWGLMSSGNYTSSLSPSRMEAWSLQQLGWITITPITTAGTYALPAVTPANHTAYLIRVANPNPRGEYYLIENRQGVLSDSALISRHCTTSGLTFPSNCHGGMAIWHVDSVNIKNFGFASGANSVNSHNPHGLLLVQADGLSQLEKAQNRGNAGDVWPGYGTGTPNPAGGYLLTSNPKAVANDSLTFIGFQIDQITQVVPEGNMSFRVSFGVATVIAASDTLAKVTVDGTPYGRFADVLANGSSHTISIATQQTSADGRARFTFQTWSDGGAQTHTITGSIAGATITANVASEYKIQVPISGNGTVTSNPSGLDLTNGAFRPKNSSVQLTATATGPSIFDRWTGDTITTANPLTLTMSKPYTVTAVFAGPLAVDPAPPPAGIMGKPYSFSFTVSGGNGFNIWSVQSGALPPGTVLSSGGVLSGIPTAAGTSNAALRVASGSQNVTTNVSITVTEPTLALNAVLPQLLGTGTSLSADDMKYLDLIGNNNGGYDVGDFLAWVNKTNATPASPPAPATTPPVAAATEGKVAP